MKRNVSLVFAAFIFLLIPLQAFAALTLTFQAQATSLFVDAAGTWTIRITNPDAGTVTGQTLTVTLPSGYVVTSAGGGADSLGPPHTLTWSGLTINGGGGYIEKTFSAKPDCTASSGGVMQAAVSAVTRSSSAITILTLGVSFQTETTSISVGQEGTWVVRVNNTNGTTATGRTIVARVPAGFRISNAGGGTVVTGSPSTITWSSQTINANSFKDFTFKAIPSCGTVSGQVMSAYAHCTSTLADSSAITIKTPSPSLKVTSGGSTQPTVHKGDTVVWDIVASNGGPGDIVSGLNLTQTLGTGYTFVSLKDSDGNSVSYTGDWSTGASWNTGAISPNTTKTYTLTVTVTGCNDWSTNISGTWNDGVNQCGSVSAAAAAQFVKNLPVVSLAQSFPNPLAYCGYPENGNTSTIRVENTGPGPAENFNLALTGMPADWGIKNINVTTGGSGSVTWNAGTKTFSIGQVSKAGGTRPVVEFTFTIGPTGSACPPTSNASLILFPQYTDECGVSSAPPVVGPIPLTVQTSSVPSASMTLTGPRVVHANDTNRSYSFTGTYNADASYGNLGFNFVFNYPTGYTVTDAAGGTISGNQITWSGEVLTPGESFGKTVQLTAPNSCGAGTDTSFSTSMTAVHNLSTCIGCSILLTAGASTSTFIDDYIGPVNTSSKSVQYYNSMTSVLDAGLTRGEVCTVNRYTVTYTFNTGANAPSTWSDTDGLGHNLSLYDQMSFGQTFNTIVSVKVDGTSYASDFSAVNFSTVPLDLGYLDSTAAPKPNAGATLEVVYDLNSGSAGGNGVDFTRLTIPGFSPPCVSKDYYEKGTLVDISASSVSVATASPTIIDVAEIKQFTLSLNANNPWPLYDPIITLDTLGNYSLVGGVGDPTYPIVFNNFYTIDGTAIAAFAPVQSGNKYEWTFTSDLRSVANSNGSGPSPSITFYMRKGCDANAKTWNAQLKYNTRCSDNEVNRTQTASATGQPVLVRKAALDIQVQPTTISAYDKYPIFKITIWNKGSGVAFNTDVQVDNGTSLKYSTHSIPSGPSPDTVTGISGDNDVTFRYNQIAPGEKRYIDIRDLVVSNSSLGISVVSGWGSGTSYCEQITKTTSVLLPPTQVIISAHSVDHRTDYCGHNSRFTVKTKNAGTVRAYNTIVTEVLPKGFVYVGNETYSISSGALTGSPTVVTSGTSASGVGVTWDFSSVLPLDSYGEHSMATGIEIEIQFDAVIDGCSGAQAYTNGDKKANASVAVDPPYNATTGGSINVSPVSILTTYAANPKVTIINESRNVTDGGTFTTNQVLADYGETIEYRITLKSVGDFLASNVRLETILPANVTWIAGSTNVDGVANAWQPGVSGSPLSLGEMSINTSDMSQEYIIIYQGTVNDATSDTIHQATVKWGCGSCSGTVPAMEQTTAASNLSLRTIPVLTITVSTQTYGVTGTTQFRNDGGHLRIQIANAGTRALLDAGDYLTIKPPTGFNFNDSASYPPTISGKSGHTLTASPSSITNTTALGDAGRGELRWDNTKIDYIDQGETITLDFYAEADGRYLDTVPSGYGQNSEPPAIPNSTVTATLYYHYIDSGSPTAANKASNNLPVDPYQADLDISIDPATPVVQPGELQKTFTIKIKNNGDAVAANVAKVAGSINEPFVLNFGNGFTHPVYTNNCGGSVSVAGNTITISNMSNFNAGQEKTFVLTLDVIEGRPNSDYWIDARIRGTAMKDAINPVSSYSVGGPGSGYSTYSDDYIYVQAAEGRLVLRPDNMGSGRAGGEIIYLHTVKNNGAIADDIQLTATNSLGWSSLFYLVNAAGQITGGPITKVTLGAAGAVNDTANIAVRVFIPSSAAGNSVNVTTVKATYTYDSQVYRTVKDTTTVGSSQLFMKKETRNLTLAGAFGNKADGKPGETIEYRISFQNYSAKEISTIIISDPIPPFSDLVTAAYPSSTPTHALHFVFYFADATVDVYADSAGAHAPVYIDFNALTADPALSARFADGIFRLKAGERGELYYQIVIQN